MRPMSWDPHMCFLFRVKIAQCRVSGLSWPSMLVVTFACPSVVCECAVVPEWVEFLGRLPLVEYNRVFFPLCSFEDCKVCWHKETQ